MANCLVSHYSTLALINLFQVYCEAVIDGAHHIGFNIPIPLMGYISIGATIQPLNGGTKSVGRIWKAFHITDIISICIVNL